MFTKTPAETAASGPVADLAPTAALTSVPGGPPIPHAVGVSDDEFRAALARLAAGVVLITAHDPDDGPRGEDVGMTATAFLSVSLDPPLVMVSVRNDSRMDDLLERQPDWAVSVLSGHQRQIAGRFAMKGRISDRLLFEDIPYVRGETSGAPLVGGALANLECRTEQRVPAGDHTLVIARVLATSVPSREDGPLTYFRGKYRQLR
ncbi:flavin reductase family protein [Streptomyces sp. NPDC058773]|uniref:flavin reductase family protein n=1 Tax=Streptomyces sp. NPDC058773 TaxID=3346632 RepID=UPI0036AB40A9